jgi:hypothetical protein
MVLVVLVVLVLKILLFNESKNDFIINPIILNFYRIELSVKSSKESIETVSLLKTGNKVVENTLK